MISAGSPSQLHNAGTLSPFGQRPYRDHDEVESRSTIPATKVGFDDRQAMSAVAVTAPTPGIATSRRQASFSCAVCLSTASASSIRLVNCSSSTFSCANSRRKAP